MHATRKVKLKDLSQNLTCFICRGYFIDATTIIECVHSFCRACIVQHLEKSEYCPICEVQLHSSRPLSSIRSDKMLQEIVYKLVPGLFQNEMTNRRQYYNEHSDVKPRTASDGGQVFNESYITSDDMIHLSLEFDTTDKKLRESTKRFILCPAAVSIAILKKLIQGKYDLKNTSCIEIMYRERYLPDDILLMDIAYKYSWSQNGNGPLQLYYRVQGIPKHPSPFKCKSFPRDPHPIKSHSVKSTKKRPVVEAEEKFTPLHKGNSAKLSAKKSLTPSGRPRGRPKRKPSISSEDPVVDLKRPKLDKGDTVTEEKKKKSKGAKKEKKAKRIETEVKDTSQGTEVQLRISENGVISAKSVTSGEEKIINPGASPLKSSSPSAFNRVCPSPIIGYSRKPVTTNGNHSRRPESPGPMDVDQDSPLPLTKKRVENGNHDEGRFVPKLENGGSPPENKDHRPDYLLKVPTPTKWIHHSSNNPAVNAGGLKLVTKASPAKDSLGFNTTTTTSSPSKKPPKFFKSRISESQSGTNGHNPSKADAIPESTSTKSDLKVPSTHKSPTRPGTHENGTGRQDFRESPPSGVELRKPESTAPAYPAEHPPPPPSPTCQQMTHHQYPNFGLHVDDNMNMGGLGLGQMHFVPSLPNGYCSFPFFPNPNPAMHPLLQMAMSMNLNSPFSYAHNSTPSPIPTGSSKSQKKSKGKSMMNNSLDLSMAAAKKSKSSSYVQISPKKSHVEDSEKKEKLEQVKATLTSSAATFAEGFRTPPKKERSKLVTPRKVATPRKILTITDVPQSTDVPVAPGPRNDLVRNEEQKTVTRLPSPVKDGMGGAGGSDKSPATKFLAEALSNGGSSSDRFFSSTVKDETPKPNLCDDPMSDPMPTLTLVESSSDSAPQEALGKEIILETSEASANSPPAPQSPSTSTVLATATLTVTVEEPKEVSSAESRTTPPGTPGGKSPATTINNNNNIVRSSDLDTNPPGSPGVAPCPSVSVNIISSSTTTSTATSSA